MSLNTASDQLGLLGPAGCLAAEAVADLRCLADTAGTELTTLAAVAGVWTAKVRAAAQPAHLSSPRLADALLTRAYNTPLTHTCQRCDQQVHRLALPYTDTGDGFSSEFANPHGFAWCPALPGDTPGQLVAHQVTDTSPADDEDPDNDPCDRCGEPTSPLYLKPTGAADPDTGLSRLVCPRCWADADGARL